MNDRTRRILTTFGAAALFSLILGAPFAFLEIHNNAAVGSSSLHFPFALFVVLWLLPTAFFLIVAPIVRSLRAGEKVLAHPVALLFRVALLILLATAWGGLINDQMPCFLGLPNCD
jgi:hypothetical protein